MATVATKTLGTLLECIEPAAPLDLSGEILRRVVSNLTADSRKVRPGGIFVALRGAQCDGHDFIADAIKRKCLAIIYEQAQELEVPNELVLIPVADSSAAFASLAAAWHDNPAEKLCLIGITGTNGKTTVSWLIESILLDAGLRVGVIGTINYRCHGEQGLYVLRDAPLTTPGPMLLQETLRAMLDCGVSHVIMEVSSHALAQGRLEPCRFDVGIFTNLTRDHLDYHQNMDAYFAAKSRLFTHYLSRQGKAVVVDSPPFEGKDWGLAMLPLIPIRQTIRCGFLPDCDLRAKDLSPELTGFACTLHFQAENVPFHSSLTGRHNVLNMLAAVACGLCLGFDLSSTVKELTKVREIPGRLQRVCLPAELMDNMQPALPALPKIFVDYAHTPDALDNVLAALRPLTKGKIFCVFGCGGDRDAGKRPLMGQSVARGAEIAVITSDNPRSEDPLTIIAAIVAGVQASGMREGSVEAVFSAEKQIEPTFLLIPDRSMAIRTACALAEADDIVLIAGKGHETYQQAGDKKHPFDDRLEARQALMNWHARHILAAVAGIGGRIVSGRQSTVLGQISTDSRSIQAGDIFVALQGEHFDGHDYIAAAVDSGAAAILARHFPVDSGPDVLCIQVQDTLQALGALAGYRRRLLTGQVKVCAITGSSGKSTVKELLAAIFVQAMQPMYADTEPVLKTKGNFNNLVGLPLSLLELEASHRAAVLEMGMSAPGEIAQLTRIADPDIGCINNVHPAHLQGLGTIEGVAAAKAELFATMRPEALRVVNCDDPQVRILAQNLGWLNNAPQVIRFACSTEGMACQPQVWVDEVENLGPSGMAFTLHIGDWQGRAATSLTGEHNVHNCAAAAAMAHAADISPQQIVDGLGSCASFLEKRLSLADLPGGLQLANDSYNANPISMAAGLRTVAAFHPEKRHVAALGDMLELGPDSANLHQNIGRDVARLAYDYLALIGEQSRFIAKGATEAGMPAEQIRIFSDFQQMASWIAELRENGAIDSGDWLFVKGSRGMRMERLIEELEYRSADRKTQV